MEAISNTTSVQLDPLDQFLAEYTPNTAHIPDIRRALSTAGIPLDSIEIGELIFCYEHTIGPQKPFTGFGETFEAHREAVSALHAIKMMMKSHHDDPWDD